MSLELSIEIEELETLQKRLKDLQNRINLKDEKVREELAEDLGKVMYNDLNKRFLSSPRTSVGGQVYGNVIWDSLSDYYLSKYPNRLMGQIYIDSGDLRRSLTSVNIDNISRINKETGEYEFGTKLEYAENLQQMRPLLFFHKQLLDELVEAYENFLVKEINKTENIQS